MSKGNVLEIFDKHEKSRIISVPVEEIHASRYQPRLRFDEEALQELSESIKETGLIQPITVRKIEEGYEIIAGERRFRACKLAGMKEVPCYVLTPTEDQAAQMALVENVQREDLSAIEEAHSYVQIMRQANLTQEQLARKIGKSQSAIANKIRLLNLPEEIQQGIIDGTITERHARALLSAAPAHQKEAYSYIVKNELNVRQTEAYVEKLAQPKRVHRRQKTRGFSHNVQIGINTVEKGVDMIRKLGIPVDSSLEELPGEVRIVVRFPKEK